MHIIQEEIGLPKISCKTNDDNNSVISIQPLPSGYGATLGNSLRRVLLSSLPGTTVIAIKITGGSHEFKTIEGIRDSILDILLNLKKVHFKKENKGQEIIKLEKKGEGSVTAADIKTTTGITIINPEQEITYITKKDTKLEMEIILEKNVGYTSAKERREDSDLSEFIVIDSLFSPVTNVKYEVTPTRVGDRTDLDKLIMEVSTNGSISPEESVKFAANVLSSYFSLFDLSEEKVESEFMSDYSTAANVKDGAEESAKESYTPIEILNLSPRTLNALINGEVGSVEQLIKCSTARLQSFRGFGKKAMDEVRDALSKKGQKLLED